MKDLTDEYIISCVSEQNSPWIIENNIDNAIDFYNFTFHRDIDVTADRYGYLNQFYPWKCDRTIKKVPESTYSGTYDEFRELIINTVTDIIKTNREIYVSWSGGIDSSSVVAAILLSGMDLSKIHICYTDSSIKENQSMYDVLCKLKIDMVYFKSLYDFSFLDDILKNNKGIVLNGWLADQFFTSGGMFYIKYGNMSTLNWKQFLKKISCPNKIIEQYESAFQEYKFNIKTSADWSWIMSLLCSSMTLSNVHRSLFLYKDNGLIIPYNTDEFIKWTISKHENYNRDDGSNPKVYKQEHKKLIYEVTKDKEWMLWKVKIGSIQGAMKKTELLHPYIVIDTNKNSYQYTWPDKLIRKSDAWRKAKTLLSAVNLVKWRIFDGTSNMCCNNRIIDI